jgi:hypothetical protein
VVPVASGDAQLGAENAQPAGARAPYAQHLVMLQGYSSHKLYFVRSGLLQVRKANNSTEFEKAMALTRTIHGYRMLAAERIAEEDEFYTTGLPIMRVINNMIPLWKNVCSA